MKGLPQTLVHNFQFEFLERPQLIPFVRAKVSLCFYDDLLASPKSQTSLVACVSLFVILALCCFFLLLFCFVLWWSGYWAVKQKIAIVQMELHRTQASHTMRKERLDGERWLCSPFLLLPCLVPRPHFSSRLKCFGSRGPCENVRAFPARSPRIRH